ncbi:hypothetical protein D9758_012241 [Tetrapyrgos nigripes]|uniref:Beta-glucuronidase C-terminal domain-containing protein n=1 Tax=Tetrapyrgos nigripes TaxID=182062 RepID=A0A8H5FIH2_9AGAR|nr:hypothetical protein D9758_012241 [Tetrapyrgos nigripes]
MSEETKLEQGLLLYLVFLDPVGSMAFRRLAISLFALWSHFCLADPIPISIPSKPSLNNVVYSNFLGISFELSFMNEYFGNDTSTIPQPMLNYLSGLRALNGPSHPIRIRVGGNSADTSTYMPNQTSPMVVLTDPNANANYQPVSYGPMLWQVLNQVAKDVGGAQYLIGVSLNDTGRDDMIVGSARQILGDSLDAVLIGNEPDLYAVHGVRPNLQNYTVDDYIGEFDTIVDQLQNTPAGNAVNGQTVAGPTICCFWDLATVLEEGYLSNFTSVLKYITLQHYPQNNCFGSYRYGLDYYLQHANVVDLAAWQQPGIDLVVANQGSGRPQLVMSEFNSASCGGIPTISDTFAVGALWTVDYALQQASVGYSATYVHTREKGISYNILTPSDDGWTTNPPFYALLATAEILRATNGSIVTDLNVENSIINTDATTAGYAVYDAQTSSIKTLVFLNFANSSAQFSLPQGLIPQNEDRNITVKYLSASSATEKYNIVWGGQTFLNVTDGKAVDFDASKLTWARQNTDVDCSNGCTIDAPGPSLAVVFLEKEATLSHSQNENHVAANGSLRIGCLGWVFGVLIRLSLFL